MRLTEITERLLHYLMIGHSVKRHWRFSNGGVAITALG